uniref:WOX9b n=1 Tax=Populus alba TaxID=43335 RepID=A0A4U5PZP4_POPAL|nr:WOX9b [Populus alba]
MASSNRHWPSLFKSKPCNPHHHHQWQHDINPSSLMSTGCHRNPYASVPGCEERSPEPKPRWNPKPEQIRILEAIFNSGMVNPPRDEIRKIRAQLQEYGQVGDANVFYWFQNRKSRSKHKLRNLQNSKQQQITPSTTKPVTHSLTAPSSLSSSSEKSSPKVSKRTLSLSSPTFIDASNSPNSSVSQTYFQSQNEFVSEPFFFPVQQTGGETVAFTQGFCFSELSSVVHVQDHTVGPCPSLLLSEITNSSASKKVNHEERNLKMQPQLSYTPTSPVTNSIDLAPPLPLSANTSTVSTQSTISQIQGLGVSGGNERSTVFINDVAFEVAMGPFNVREAFGDNILLIHSSGQPVLTNEWGITLESLQHGALYYLVPLSISEHVSSILLILETIFFCS